MNTTIKCCSTNDLYKSFVRDANEKEIITFFTPTYNRANFLERVYGCLVTQTSKQFVWILVCDGSKDNTDELAQTLLEKNEIPMLYISKENGGKHSAFKVAFEECKTRYFQCMDDDDIYSEKSVETFLKIWDTINKENKKEVGAIRTLARRPNGGYATNFNVGGEDINKYTDASTLEMNYIYHRHQENWTCYRTDALREIDLFPENYWMAEQHKFFTEGIWQSRFARKYKCRYVNIALREYRDDAEVSLIRAFKSRQHYVNMFINTKMMLDENYDYICKSTANLLKNIALLQLLRNYLGISNKELSRNTPLRKLRLFYKILYPISFMGTTIIKRKTIEYPIIVKSDDGQ